MTPRDDVPTGSKFKCIECPWSGFENDDFVNDLGEWQCPKCRRVYTLDRPADTHPTGSRHPANLGEEEMFDAGYKAGYEARWRSLLKFDGVWPGDGSCHKRWSEWLPRKEGYERRICDDCGYSEVRPVDSASPGEKP